MIEKFIRSAWKANFRSQGKRRQPRQGIEKRRKEFSRTWRVGQGRRKLDQVTGKGLEQSLFLFWQEDGSSKRNSNLEKKEVNFDLQVLARISRRENDFFYPFEAEFWASKRQKKANLPIPSRNFEGKHFQKMDGKRKLFEHARLILSFINLSLICDGLFLKVD